MPAALLRSCSKHGCPNLCHGGRCQACEQEHQRTYNRSRGSSSDQGYGAFWKAFRAAFFGMLIEAGIPPACGAVLEGGPKTMDSRCKAAGLYAVLVSEDGTSVHVDHEPPLTDAERMDPRSVCDPLRVQVLCKSCHSAKTLRENQHA